MPASVKRCKVVAPVDEIIFDLAAREDYLTGFHKRKQQRIKQAQEYAVMKAKEQKLQARKKIREQRRKDLEQHVETVNAMLRKAEDGDVDEINEEVGAETMVTGEAPIGCNDVHGEPDIGHEDEYVDEDKYTTVTVEPMRLDDDEENSPDEDEASENGTNNHLTMKDANGKFDKQHTGGAASKKRVWTKDRPDTAKSKKKKKKFRYESKVERKLSRSIQRSKNSAAAKARREAAQ